MSAAGNPILNKLFDAMIDPLRMVSYDIKTILLGSKEVLRGGAIGVPLQGAAHRHLSLRILSHNKVMTHERSQMI